MDNEYFIDKIWPINTKLHPDGGVGIDWSGPIGFGQLVIYWGKDNKLHADTECLCSNNDKNFIKTILNQLTDEIIIDG